MWALSRRRSETRAIGIYVTECAHAAPEKSRRKNLRMWRTLRWSGTGIGVRPYRVDEASARQDAAFRRAKHLRSLQAARHRRSWREIEAQDARGAFAPDHGAAATRNPPHAKVAKEIPRGSPASLRWGYPGAKRRVVPKYLSALESHNRSLNTHRRRQRAWKGKRSK